MKTMLTILAACCCMLLAACGTGAATQPAPASPESPLSAETPVGSGTLGYASEVDEPLNSAQEQLLLGYMDRSYQSLADFTVRDADDLFATDCATEAAGNEAVWSYLIGLRRMQQTDLRLISYRYSLTVIDTESQDGELRVMAMEDCTQRFASHPDVDSESYGTYHIFALRETADGWKLTRHSQWDYLYSTIMGMTREFYEQPGAFPDLDYEAQVTSLLATADGYRTARGSEDASAEQADADHMYDRSAAVAYAHTWANGRNEEWADYTRSGGNCQNYVSQCLLAGGIPMDPYGSAVWKWYGSTPNNLPGTSGRSASWSAVKQFASYAESNTGFGLVAQVGAPYYSGQPGDLIIMGNSEDWHHTVIIVEPVTDENGQTVDYLVDSNTGGLKNFPVSAHSYSCQMLIRILGWND